MIYRNKYVKINQINTLFVFILLTHVTQKLSAKKLF
jgi:hypothetical protein